MFNQNGGYSLADIAAATGVRNGNGDGMFGDNGWWIILLFLFAGWGAGFRRVVREHGNRRHTEGPS